MMAQRYICDICEIDVDYRNFGRHLLSEHKELLYVFSNVSKNVTATYFVVNNDIRQNNGVTSNLLTSKYAKYKQLSNSRNKTVFNYLCICPVCGFYTNGTTKEEASDNMTTHINEIITRRGVPHRCSNEINQCITALHQQYGRRYNFYKTYLQSLTNEYLMLVNECQESYKINTNKEPFNALERYTEEYEEYQKQYFKSRDMNTIKHENSIYKTWENYIDINGYTMDDKDDIIRMLENEVRTLNQEILAKNAYIDTLQNQVKYYITNQKNATNNLMDISMGANDADVSAVSSSMSDLAIQQEVLDNLQNMNENLSVDDSAEEEKDDESSIDEDEEENDLLLQKMIVIADKLYHYFIFKGSNYRKNEGNIYYTIVDQYVNNDAEYNDIMEDYRKTKNVKYWNEFVEFVEGIMLQWQDILNEDRLRQRYSFNNEDLKFIIACMNEFIHDKEVQSILQVTPIYSRFVKDEGENTDKEEVGSN
jgi:hypothetical protein